MLMYHSNNVNCVVHKYSHNKTSVEIINTYSNQTVKIAKYLQDIIIMIIVFYLLAKTQQSIMRLVLRVEQWNEWQTPKIYIIDFESSLIA